jgi:hypothetical protein
MTQTLLAVDFYIVCTYDNEKQVTIIYGKICHLVPMIIPMILRPFFFFFHDSLPLRTTKHSLFHASPPLHILRSFSEA